MNFEKAFDEIKRKNQEECLSDERKAELVKMVQDMYYGTSDSDCSNNDSKYKVTGIFNRYHNFHKKVVAVFACCLILSTCVFAGDFGDFLSKIFSNQDKNIEFAVEKGYVQNVDIDYVEHDGIKIRPEYFYFDDYYMYFAFDIVSDKEFNEVVFEDFEIKDDNDNIIFYDKDYNKEDMFSQIQTKRMSNNTGIAIVKISNLRNTFLDYHNLKFIIKTLSFKNQKNSVNLSSEWKFNFDINNDREKNNVEYYIDSEQVVEDYQVELKNNNLKVNLKMPEEYLKNFNMNRNNIYIEDENDNIYNVGEIVRCKKDEIETTFNIDNSPKIDNLKLKIKYDNDKILVFYLKEADG